MTRQSQDHSVQNLLAFYDRVNPALSEWVAKPEWTAEETALLCAGFIPEGNPDREDSTAADSRESIVGAIPCDPEGYLPSDHELYTGYLHLLAGKGPAAPRDMVDMLCPAITWVMKPNHESQSAEFPTLRVQTPDSLRELQWLLIIGNAVGLQVPAIVPFSLLNGLRDRLAGQPTIIEASRQRRNQLTEAVPIATAKPGRRAPLPTTPDERGYRTTAEVAGLLNLSINTLNTYARKGIAVEGYTPFKRQNGKSWQWRDDRQQAAHAANTGSQTTPASQPGKSLASFLGHTLFQK